MKRSSSLSEELRRDVIRVCRLAYFRGAPAEHLAAFEREEGYESISRIVETAPIDRRGPQSIVHYVGEVLAGLIDESAPAWVATGHPSVASSPARPRLRDVSEVLASMPERKDHTRALAENYDQDTMSEEIATLETEVNR